MWIPPSPRDIEGAVGADPHGIELRADREDLRRRQRRDGHQHHEEAHSYLDRHVEHHCSFTSVVRAGSGRAVRTASSSKTRERGFQLHLRRETSIPVVKRRYRKVDPHAGRPCGKLTTSETLRRITRYSETGPKRRSELVLFGENVTPNLHKLAREFVLLDNFYVNSDVSADGHNWSTAAIAPDYVQKMWPNKYASRRVPYDFEEQDPTSLPPAGYLWTNAAAAGVSLRNFGYMVNNKPNAAPGAEQISGVRDPVLAKVTNPLYRGFDLNYADVERAKVFLSELAEYEKTGNMPRLIVMRLGNDHTSGTAAGKIAPLSAAADNDYAVGQLVEGVSKSRFWASTAIFILEDDAQNGPDHVDSHRSPAFVISPWVKRHAVDSSMYNTTSMLRTMEFLLGMKPMTHFDAGARPMTAAFQSQPNAAPYAAEKPRISLDEKNPAATAGVPLGSGARMTFEEADTNDDDELNDILWRTIRKDAPPPPVRSIFGR